MLVYIFGITKRDNKGITTWGRFYGLQIAQEGLQTGTA